MREAESAWVQSYLLAKKLNLAQVLQALEGLAEQLGLEGGMEGWATLAARFETRE